MAQSPLNEDGKKNSRKKDAIEEETQTFPTFVTAHGRGPSQLGLASSVRNSKSEVYATTKHTTMSACT